MDPVADQQASAAAVATYRLPVGAPHPERERLPSEQERAWIEPLLWRNAVWFGRLRWIVVSVLAIAGLAGFFPSLNAPLGLTIRPLWPLAAAAVLVATNLLFARLASTAGRARWNVPVKVQLWCQIVTDLLVLTAVIHWLGSELPTAPFMYLFHVILACIVFSPRESLLVAGLAAGFYVGCLALESRGVVEPTCVLTSHGMARAAGVCVPRGFSVGSMLLIWVVIWYLVSHLAGTLLQRERDLALTNLRLKASSEERAKHMLQTTHQLKAPFAAIHAQAQLLLGGYCGPLPDTARGVVEKISTRCAALSRQIQEMLQLANLRSRGQGAPPKTDLDLAALIDAALARVEPAARQRGIRLEKAVAPVKVHGAEDHLTMLLDNLLVNAVTYSHDHGKVQVTCRAEPPGQATLVVRDHGIGIPAAKLARIFDDYYRTEEAVQHNRMSTGLGLAIVRHVAQEAQLAVEVQSAPGWGTRFAVTLPGALPA